MVCYAWRFGLADLRVLWVPLLLVDLDGLRYVGLFVIAVLSLEMLVYFCQYCYWFVCG